jgi:hypothetical protein
MSRFDAAIVGGALYANRWNRDARRFISRHDSALRRMPSWCFSSGPLVVMHDTRVFGSVAGTWLPLALIFLATWITGSIMAMMPAQTVGRRVRSARTYTMT